MRREGNKIIIIETADLPAPTGVLKDVQGRHLIDRIQALQSNAISALVQSDNWHYPPALADGHIPQRLDGTLEIRADDSYVVAEDCVIVPQQANEFRAIVADERHAINTALAARSIIREKADAHRMTADTRLAFRDTLRSIMRGNTSDDELANSIVREMTEWHDDGRPDAITTKRRVQANFNVQQNDMRWMMFAIREYASECDLPPTIRQWESFDWQTKTIVHRAVGRAEHLAWKLDHDVSAISLEWGTDGVIIGRTFVASDYLQYLMNNPMKSLQAENTAINASERADFTVDVDDFIFRDASILDRDGYGDT